jgi:hypothetical protein
MKKAQNVIVRVPIETHDKLKKVAEEETRSINKLILHFITIGLKKYGKSKKD